MKALVVDVVQKALRRRGNERTGEGNVAEAVAGVHSFFVVRRRHVAKRKEKNDGAEYKKRPHRIFGLSFLAETQNKRDDETRRVDPQRHLIGSACQTQ